MSQLYLIYDYETRSEADIKLTGGYEYSRHPSTEIMCVAWRFGTREQLGKTRVRSWHFRSGEPVPRELIGALSDPNVICVSHNSLFEQVITRFVLAPLVRDPRLANIPPSRFICTASLARHMALPGNLEGAAQALKLKHEKDAVGHRLMLKLSKPRKPTKNNPAKWHESPAEIARLVEYCERDILAETELFLRLPPLPAREREIWELDQKINWRGIKIDRDTVGKALSMVNEEAENLTSQVGELSLGILESTNQRNEVLDWLRANGCALPDLTAKTISDAIAAGMASGDVLKMLEIRQATSKTSTAKYVAFDFRSRTDGRLRDLLVYHGASPTARWTGAGVQPQNFPRGTVKDTDTAIDAIKLGDLEIVRMMYGNPMPVFSSCLRGMITASPGKELFCADYAAIEARVLAWVAGQDRVLEMYRKGVDRYVLMAAKIYGKDPLEVTKQERELGKRAVLGCGYGMGADKFEQTCAAQGQPVESELAQVAVKAYRGENPEVVRAWYNVERAAIAAVQNPGKRYRTNLTTWVKEGDFLFCELPSGRRMAYPYPEIKMRPTPWGEKRPSLSYWGVNPVTRKWAREGSYGGKIIENVVQAIARDLMAFGMLRLERRGYEVLITVHDEILGERKIGLGSVEEFERLMAELPPWAKGLVVKAEGWKGFRYKK